jgi:hypothetical protein
MGCRISSKLAKKPERSSQLICMKWERGLSRKLRRIKSTRRLSSMKTRLFKQRFKAYLIKSELKNHKTEKWHRGLLF